MKTFSELRFKDTLYTVRLTQESCKIVYNKVLQNEYLFARHEITRQGDKTRFCFDSENGSKSVYVKDQFIYSTDLDLLKQHIKIEAEKLIRKQELKIQQVQESLGKIKETYKEYLNV